MNRFLFLSAYLLSATTYSAETIDFARQVLPVLSDKCFLCHGPDTKKKKDLRLDSYAGATADRGGYKGIDPDNLSKSEVIARIFDHEDPMPPEDAEKQLKPHERELIKQWILQGGEYANHWAFIPPKKSAKAQNIDGFIARGHATAKTSFAPEADRATLARRVALVLTGLPPEPEQLADYLKDGNYAQLVDRLLASPRYGEHQARYWLDAVRYGDTHGLHLDNRRAIYPYRDWVVRAFNRNMPMDQFITEQLAGDLLPNPTLEQQIATGFVRMNPTTAEGGAIPEEFQAKNNFDRVENLGTVLLGMTLNCARCHTHKYDPIQQEEYYRLMAFFNSTAESPMDGNSYLYEPVLHVPRDQPAWEQWSELEQARDALLKKLKVDDAAALAYAKSIHGWKTKEWQISKDRNLDAEPPAKGAKEWKDQGGLPGDVRNKLSKVDKAKWLRFVIEAPAAQQLQLSFAGGPGSKVMLNAQEQEIALSEGRLQTLPLPVIQGRNEVLLKLTGEEPQVTMSVHLESPWRELAKQKSWAKLEADQKVLALGDASGPLASHASHTAAKALAQQIVAAKTDFTITLVAKELPKPRPTKVLMRGEYHLPIGEDLEPGILTAMGVFPADAPRNRLGLAKWLTSKNQPVVARVLVNRIWQRTFGYGLVRTPEDFGLQGEQPTHPELLDWLSVELQEKGWDMKHLLKLMVTSRTFKQHARFREDVSDPDNRLWARGPSFRMDAEVIRDLGLWASGLLEPHQGGEGIKPYQPEGLWSALMHPGSNTKKYVVDQGDRLYRRSLYVYWKRTSPHPMMTLFNAPDREASCVRRDRSSTPLQSLGLLNETQRVEMGRVFAEQLLSLEGGDEQRLNQLFTRVACRPPTTKEKTACLSLLNAMRERYAAAAPEALALVSTGQFPRNKDLASAEHAAWTQVAITVLASDVALIVN